ncbi:MAG: 50S ribosomal protein L29 [Phycisphaerales bacterium]|nr:50S ribosomal protein L29 [Phycisphaerales bacterium]
MDMREIRKLGDDEIDIEVERLRRRLFELRTQMVTEKIQNTSQFGVAKKTIARLLTEKRARSMAGSAAE